MGQTILRLENQIARQPPRYFSVMLAPRLPAMWGKATLAGCCYPEHLHETPPAKRAPRDPMVALGPPDLLSRQRLMASLIGPFESAFNETELSTVPAVLWFRCYPRFKRDFRPARHFSLDAASPCSPQVPKCEALFTLLPFRSRLLSLIPSRTIYISFRGRQRQADVCPCFGVSDGCPCRRTFP